MSSPARHDLPQEFESLISRQFDGELSREEHRRLAKWINSKPDNARMFVELAMLHDRLLPEVSPAREPSGEFLGNTPNSLPRPTRTQRQFLWAVGVTSSVAALLLASFFILQMFQGSPVLAAEMQLVRLIEVARRSSDRTYLISSLDLRESKRPNRNRARFQHQSIRGLNKPRAPIDGALLHVRGENSFVLIRRFANGDELITGSDGHTSWSVPAQGRVRVSDDVARFRGGIPGDQHAIPLINLHDDLRQIRNAYDIQWPDFVSANREPNAELSCLVAEKKSAQHRGPKHVEIWFDSETGVIVEMLLDKLPRARGGPDTVLLELIDQSELPVEFFEHTSHHASDRKIKHDRN